MIDNSYRKRVSEKKRCQLFENCANFACVQFSQSLIFATIGGFVRLNIRFASAGMCLLDTELTNVCVDMR